MKVLKLKLQLKAAHLPRPGYDNVFIWVTYFCKIWKSKLLQLQQIKTVVFFYSNFPSITLLCQMVLKWPQRFSGVGVFNLHLMGCVYIVFGHF